MLNSMVARFLNDEIVKAQLDPDNSEVVYITTLDGNGDEVIHTLSYDMPACLIKFVNNSSVDVSVWPVLFGSYGIDLKETVLKSGETVTLPFIYGTLDDSTYLTSVTYSPYNLTTITISDTVNCTEYGGYIVIVDPTEDSSCTMTFTDL